MIDFDSLVGINVVSRGCTYLEDGFVLEYASPCPAGGEFRSNHPPSLTYSASVSFYNNSQLGITRLAMSGGGVFALVSIDLDALNGKSHSVPPFRLGSVTFMGTLPNGATATETFVMDDVFPARQTFRFSAPFEPVTQVTWQQTASYPDPGHQFDNIVVTPQRGR